MNQETFVELWHDPDISLAFLAEVAKSTPAQVVQRGESLNLNGKLERWQKCETCWFLVHCKTKEALRSDRLPCEGGEPVPYVDPGYMVYRSPRGEMIVRNE